RTTSDAQTQIKGNVVYVATDKESPVSLYITPPGQEAPALSVTLVPRRIPPREITLAIDGQQWPIKGVVNRKAATWETAQPYVDSLRDLLRRLALNELPQGYDIRLASQSDTSPKCFQPGLKFGFKQGQIVTGHYFTVYVGLVESFADEPIEASEIACHTPDIVASAYWPRNILLPGEKTELYVVVRNHREEAVESQRPSLLVGGK
ncbi:TraK domain-containing protein, partial [Vibrio alginolyticus]